MRWALLAMGLLTACGAAVTTNSVEAPDATVRAYAAALRAGDAAAIRELMTAETQARVSEAEVARLLEENREELRERAQQAEAALEGGVSTRAAVRLVDGEVAVLGLEAGHWRIVGGVLDAPALLTPEDAVRSLRMFLRRRSLPGLLRVLAHGPRADLEAEVARFLDDTEDELDWETEVHDNEAFVRTSAGRVIHLVREAGEWRVADVE